MLKSWQLNTVTTYAVGKKKPENFGIWILASAIPVQRSALTNWASKPTGSLSLNNIGSEYQHSETSITRTPSDTAQVSV